MINEEPNILAVQKTIGVKLFVGQIPKIWKEEEIIEFFQKFGKVQDAQIIRDSQGAHRGCAFVTFISMTDADVAMRALNETFFLPGSTAKLQLKWADGEDRRLGLETVNIQHANKILIMGILPNVQEHQIRKTFEVFGHIRLLKLVRTRTNSNRAYIKFATKEQAITAVKETHERLIFPDTNKPVSVHFAESKRINKSVPFGQLMPKRRIMTVNDPIKEEPEIEIKRLPKREVQERKIIEQRIFFEFFCDNEKKYYYFNQKTNKTQWERPEGEGVIIKPAEEYY
jgi:RNA recognition motif-containing protein